MGVAMQVELVKQWNKEAPEDKIICYSQWTSMIDSQYLHKSPTSMFLIPPYSVVVELFERDNIKTLRYDGKMSRTMRDETIKHFKKPKGPKILIIRYVACPFHPQSRPSSSIS